MLNKLGCILLLIALTALPLTAPVAGAQQEEGEITVHAIGSSRTRTTDMSAGREEAIRDGLIMAVSRVLSDVLPAQVLVGQFQLVNESVLSRADQFVRDYKVLTESTAGSAYRLVVQATISVSQLKETLKAAGVRLGKLPYPRVLVCVAEKRVDDFAPRYWWSGLDEVADNASSGAISRILSQTGFIVVRPGGGVTANYPPELSTAEAVSLGQQFEADVVVVGLASLEKAVNAMSGTSLSYRGIFSTKAFRVTDGQPLAQVQRTAMTAPDDAGSGDKDPLYSVTAQVGEELSVKIASAWFRQAALGTGMEIQVRGVSGYIANFVQFRGALSTISGLDNLQLKEMMPDTAVLSVRYQGGAGALAESLLQLHFENFNINIEQVESKTIQLQLMPR